MKKMWMAALFALAVGPAVAQIEAVKPEDLDAVPLGHQDIARQLGPVGGNLSGRNDRSGRPMLPPGTVANAPAVSSSTDPRDLSGYWRGGGGPPGSQRAGTERSYEGNERPGPRIRSKYELALLCLVESGVEVGGGEIFQSPTMITWLKNDDLRARRIYLDAQHPKDLKPTYNGHSVAHWEGNTLVIDTVALQGTFGYVGESFHRPGTDIYDQVTEKVGQKLPKPTEYFRNEVVMISPTLHVVERLTKINNNTQLQHELAFDDAATGMQPYTIKAVYDFGRTGEYLELFCEDGNDKFGPQYAEDASN